jgi:hypothetical protein
VIAPLPGLARSIAAATASACLLAGCATGAPVGSLADGSAFHPLGRPAPPAPVPSSVPARPALLGEDARAAVVSAARELVGTKTGADCTGLVRAVFDRVHVNLMTDAEPGDNGVTAIYRFALGRGRVFTGGHPLPGDLVFFRDTYDRNDDGQPNDGLTHVGLVESIDPDGTVSVIHRVQRGVVRYRMNLAHPDARKDPRSGLAINDYLRPQTRGAPAVLTGQLFAAYATLFLREAPVASAR